MDCLSWRRYNQHTTRPHDIQQIRTLGERYAASFPDQLYCATRNSTRAVSTERNPKSDKHMYMEASAVRHAQWCMHVYYACTRRFGMCGNGQHEVCSKLNIDPTTIAVLLRGPNRLRGGGTRDCHQLPAQHHTGKGCLAGRAACPVVSSRKTPQQFNWEKLLADIFLLQRMAPQRTVPIW